MDYRDLVLSDKEGIEKVRKKRKKPTMEMDKIAAAIVALSDSQQSMMEFQQQFMEQQQRQAQYEPNRERPMERKPQVISWMPLRPLCNHRRLRKTNGDFN